MNLKVLNEAFADTVNANSEGRIVVASSCDIKEAFNFQELQVTEVENLLSALKLGTATGCDELPAQFISNVAPAIAPNITKILNSSIHSSTFPDAWKKAHVTPIWKSKGSKKDPSNYRPISVLPVLARLFEKICAKQLGSYCLSRGVIPDAQFGFREHSSCEHALISALDCWMSSVDKGEVVGALLIDLSKAFDTVSHELLLNELLTIG